MNENINNKDKENENGNCRTRNLDKLVDLYIQICTKYETIDDVKDINTEELKILQNVEQNILNSIDLLKILETSSQKEIISTANELKEINNMLLRTMIICNL